MIISSKRNLCFDDVGLFRKNYTEKHQVIGLFGECLKEKHICTIRGILACVNTSHYKEVFNDYTIAATVAGPILILHYYV